ncbi:MAG: hypothetical protein QOF40_3455 [Actinomycetota bacterium]|jgi:hypothetical protein|nr:hypothetical protein [Actinomycetota bacterium]
MSAEVVAVAGAEPLTRFEQSLQAEQAAERHLLKSLVKSILLTLPVSIAVFVFIAAVSISDKTEWYVWLGLGVGIGVVGAFLMGALAGATLNAHKLDDVDRETFS